MKSTTSNILIAATSILASKNVCAFVLSSSGVSTKTNFESGSAIRLSDEILEEIPDEPSTLTEYFESSQSKSIPFLERPEFLDGSIAGDVGFDPLGFAKTEKRLQIFREAEVKHARLAMLAAAGWPLSELLNNKFADVLDLAPALDSAGSASPFNANISDNFWIGALAFASVVDLYGSYKALENEPDYFPGNLGFDPLSLYPKDPMEQKAMQLAEIKHGRTAMVVVAFYFIEEYMTKSNLFNPLHL